MVNKFKLKHLIRLEETSTPDYANMMIELDGYKNRIWGRKKHFLKSLQKIFLAFEEFKKIDPTKLEINSNEIKYPEDINNIPFIAMIQLISSIKNEEKLSTSKHIGEIVAIACYNSHMQLDFDFDSKSFKRFQNVIENTSAVLILGIFNNIIDQVDSTSKVWEKLFFEVSVEDSDYSLAGGSMLDKFNVINTIKKTCKDFNLPYEKALQLPYSIVQLNSLSDATSYYIQNNLSKIKEKRMRAKRGI